VILFREIFKEFVGWAFLRSFKAVIVFKIQAIYIFTGFRFGVFVYFSSNYFLVQDPFLFLGKDQTNYFVHDQNG
jgi:hypothetical protein